MRAFSSRSPPLEAADGEVTRSASSAASSKWGILRARSVRKMPLAEAGEEEDIPKPRPLSIRRISEVALGKVRSGMGLATSAKRKSSMRKQRRATSREDLAVVGHLETGEMRTSSARMSETASNSPELEPVNVQCGGASCRGKGKRRNEDRIVVLAHLIHEEKSTKSSVGYAAVFDGHGGERCVEHIAMKLPTLIGHRIFVVKDEEEISRWKHVTKIAMARAIHEMDREYIEIAVPRRDVSGACAVMATVRGCEVTIAHVGDCRAILLHPDDEPDKGDEESEFPRVTRLTRDHVVSDPDEIERIRVAGGKILEGRLNGVLEPTRAFGDADIKMSQDGLIVDPEITYRVVDPGAVLILCSDGITASFSDEELGKMVLKDLRENNFDPSHAAATVCKEAAETGLDDSSAVILVFQPK